jgi:hypothetical protein
MFTFDVPPKLLRQIARYAREDLLDKLVGLGVSPEYQANAARIETLIHIALIAANGIKRATRNDLAKLLNGFEGHAAVKHEDPAEDIFVSAVSTLTGQFRIFNGIYPAADYSLQRLLDAVLAQDFEYHDSIARQCDALLRLSEVLAERCGFAAYEFAESTQWRTDWPLSLPLLLTRGAATRFTREDLVELGVDIADLEPFCVVSLDGLLDARFGETLLNRWPVMIAEDNGVHLPIPSYISPALRLYLAHAIASGIVPRKAIETFHDHEFTRWIGVHLPLRRTRPLEMGPLDLPEPHLDIPHLTQAVLRFDEDKVAHLLVLGCDWRDPPERNIHERNTPSASLQKNFANYLRVVRDKLFSDMGVNLGLTLVVQDSPGWSTFIQLPGDFAENWYCTGFPARIFAFLLADHAFSLVDLWKMLREVRELEAKGVRMMAWPDILNYWSIWQALGSTFWLPTVDLRAFGAFAPDTSKIVEVVRQIRLGTNPHATPLPNGELLRVERWVEELSPSQDYTKPIYLDPFSIVLGELRAVVETQYGPWWVASARPPFDPQDRQLIYLIWQAATEWTLRIAQSAFSRLPASTQPLEIRLLTVPETILDAPDEIEFVRAKDMAVVTIILPPRFSDKLMTVDNTGERLLIGALIEGILTVLDQSLSDKDKSEWLAEVAANPDLKMIHVTAGGDHGYAADLVAERLSFRFLQETDLAAAKRFMREALEVIPTSGVTRKTGTVSGDATHAVLHSAVDVHWHRCKTILASLDREQTLILVSRLIEALHRERVSSERGALARLRHYAESPEYSDIARITVGRRDRSFLAYRIVAEMALCECPLSGGRVPGLTDIDKLAAEVAELVAVAHDSDAVARGLIEPELRFRADGAIEPAHGGAAAFIQSYTLACLSESIALDVDAYQTLFERDAEDIGTLLRENDFFMLAFQAEFGLDLRKSFEISNALQSITIDQKKDVASIRRRQLETLLAERSPSIDGAALFNFLNAFGLAARSAWESEPTAPHNRSDVWPWLFERRLSLMLRPVLIVPDRVDDPLLIFGVRQIDMGVRYASTLLETGGWPKEKLSSEAARAFTDQEINQRGHAFEAEVAELMRRGGWKAIESLLMKRLGATNQLGDLDVLAVGKDGRRWWVIECKWFGAARTPREIANWLQDFRGHDGDKLDRHLKRLAWIREHRKLVTARLELPYVPEAIEPKIVTTSPVPLELQKHLPAGSDVLTKRNLIDLLGGQDHA